MESSFLAWLNLGCCVVIIDNLLVLNILLLQIERKQGGLLLGFNIHIIKCSAETLK